MEFLRYLAGFNRRKPIANYHYLGWICDLSDVISNWVGYAHNLVGKASTRAIKKPPGKASRRLPPVHRLHLECKVSCADDTAAKKAANTQQKRFCRTVNVYRVNPMPKENGRQDKRSQYEAGSLQQTGHQRKMKNPDLVLVEPLANRRQGAEREQLTVIVKKLDQVIEINLAAAKFVGDIDE